MFPKIQVRSIQNGCGITCSPSTFFSINQGAEVFHYSPRFHLRVETVPSGKWLVVHQMASTPPLLWEAKLPVDTECLGFFFLCTPNQKHCKHMKSSYLKGQDGMVRGFQKSGTWFPVLCYFSNKPSPSISYIIFSFLTTVLVSNFIVSWCIFYFKKIPPPPPNKKRGQ